MAAKEKIKGASPYPSLIVGLVIGSLPAMAAYGEKKMSGTLPEDLNEFIEAFWPTYKWAIAAFIASFIVLWGSHYVTTHFKKESETHNPDED